MATKNQLSGGAFQDAIGTVMANGYLLMELSQDSLVNGNTQVVAGRTIRINLDGSGNVVASPAQSIWPNDVLTPSGTFYNVSGYNQNGQLVWGPNAQQVLSTPSPFNIGVWIPADVNTGSGGGGGGGNVTSFSFTDANGILGTVTNSTTTPNLTLELDNITPSSISVNGSQVFNGAQGIGSSIMSFTGSTGNNQVLGTDSDGTAVITGIGVGNLVTTVGTNVFVGSNAFTTNLNLENVNAATSGSNKSAPSLLYTGSYWNGSAPAADNWAITQTLGIGTNPTSTLDIIHVGTPGVVTAKVNGNEILTAAGAATSSSTASNFSVPVVISGTTYYIRLSSTP